MNPKAIQPQEMFGRNDPIQNEWTDGIFSALWKEANANKKQNIWIICDGPVDSLWIENLNTVLDDNKLLTLANGDRIPMADTVKMCFEAENLNNASPATVSRAGQIYISDIILGWEPIIKAVIQNGYEKKNESQVIKPFNEKESQIIISLFKKNIDESMKFIKKNLNQIMDVPLSNQAVTCLNLLITLMKEYREESKDIDEKNIERLFFFSLAWSVGGILEKEDQVKFSQYLKTRSKLLPSSQDDIYQFYLDKKDKKWKFWKDIVPEWKYPENDILDFSSLYIPTLDSVRIEFLMERLSNFQKNIILIGGSGTAKTVTIEHFMSKLNEEVMKIKKINFSSATTQAIFQNTIENVIEKRFRVYGPPQGKKLTVFIDDINMPEINEWKDQVTNEIVRQLIEQGGFYNLALPGEWFQIVDLQFIGAMSHPGKNF